MEPWWNPRGTLPQTTPTTPQPSQNLMEPDGTLPDHPGNQEKGEARHDWAPPNSLAQNQNHPTWLFLQTLPKSASRCSAPGDLGLGLQGFKALLDVGGQLLPVHRQQPGRLPRSLARVEADAFPTYPKGVNMGPGRLGEICVFQVCGILTKPKKKKKLPSKWLLGASGLEAGDGFRSPSTNARGSKPETANPNHRTRDVAHYEYDGLKNLRVNIYLKIREPKKRVSFKNHPKRDPQKESYVCLKIGDPPKKSYQTKQIPPFSPPQTKKKA